VGLDTRHLSNEELTEWRRKALMRLYLRPSHIAKTLWRARSPKKVAHYLKAGAFRLRSLMSTGG
jgi:hypothetical protein